jgi:hypothetical protein
MLSEYIAHRIQELHEKAYNKLVLILASSAMASVLLSGLALLASPAFKYLAVAVFISGILLAEKVHKNTLKKMRKLLTNPEREIVARRYIAALKDLYAADEIIHRALVEPQIEDPVVKKEKKPIVISAPLFKARYAALKTRSKIVITATSLSIILPHFIVTKDIILTIIVLAILLLTRKVI